MRDFAADLVAAASRLDQKPALVGASLGGLAGLIAAGELAPGSFASLTLVDIAPRMEPSGVMRVVGFMEEHVDSGFASPEEAADVIARYMPHRPKRGASDGLKNYLRQKSDGRFYWHWDPVFIRNIMSARQGDPDSQERQSAMLSQAAANLTLPLHLIRGGSSFRRGRFASATTRPPCRIHRYCRCHAHGRGRCERCLLRRYRRFPTNPSLLRYGSTTGDEGAMIDRERLQEMLNIAPFHRWLGLEIATCSDQGIAITMPWREEIVSNPMIGSAHGGILASLVDLTGLYTLLAGGVAARATADLHVDYHRPATSGPLTAHGQIVKIGRQISVAETRVLEPDDKLVASGRGAYFSSTGSLDQRGGTIDLEQALATQGPATSAARSTPA